jgi:ssDNA-binding replication factor A large subunit
MNTGELVKNSKVNNLIGTITFLRPPEESSISGVAIQEGILADEVGQVKISLWKEQVGHFKVGDKILLSTGWCKEFEGELQVSTGLYGKIRVIPTEKVS